MAYLTFARLELGKESFKFSEQFDFCSERLKNALKVGFSDFEDAVLYQSAKNANIDTIVTRNIKDFKLAQLPVYAPDELLAVLSLL